MFRIPWRQVSDAQYIEKLRRTMALWDRYRPWLVVFYAAILGLLAWSVTKGVRFLVGLARPANAPWPLFGFVAGALFGLVIGWLFHFVVVSLARGLANFRAERLLVRYYDAIVSANKAGASDEGESEKS